VPVMAVFKNVWGKKFVLGTILLLIFPFQSFSNDSLQVSIDLPAIVIKGIASTVEVFTDDINFSGEIIVNCANNQFKVLLEHGRGTFNHCFNEEQFIQSEYLTEPVPVNPIPLWLSIIPPLLAIFMALLFREVVTSLFLGILVGTSIIYYYQSGAFFEGIFQGLLAIIDTYVIESLLDSGHISIIVFSMLIGAMVGVITKNGGMKGVVNKLVRFANTPRSGQFITWILGIAIFFDDYANTLVVGNTMRPVTDKLKVSRQKLAYIVDSTAAPVAAIAFVTTWIGAELSYIESGIETLGLSLSPYTVFLNSLAYSFYPVFTLIFMFILIYRKVDFGPMHTIETETRKTGVLQINNEAKDKIVDEFETGENIPARWYNAVIPVVIVIMGTFAGLVYTGIQNSDLIETHHSFFTRLSVIIGNSDSYKALLWASLLATIVAVVLSVSQRILTLQQSVEAIINGFKTMLSAIVILILAWSLALVTQHLHTADFISKILVDSSLSPIFVPLITFVLAALVAFSTGSSWGTMAILYPLILPVSWLITQEYGYEYNQSLNIFYNVVASVLAGSVLGDHCSPISDTTILSSLASSCNHIDHVRTQMPYALTVGAVASLVGVLPAALGISSWITFPLGFAVLYLIVRVFGKSTELK
jgi:Na+/H+ antiporter NhaC